jgi:hypothetical protein
VARAWNLFSLGRRHHDEDQLTEMLIWLAEAVPAVRSACVTLALGVSVDPAAIEPRTQYVISDGRLDALFEGGGVRLIVESKLGSTYAEGQVRKYLRWLAEHHTPVAQAGLMTLTIDDAPWGPDDLKYAHDNRLGTSASRWEELHRRLQPLVAQSPEDSLEGRMIREFLEMLDEEGLVPVEPLGVDDLGDQWAESWNVVWRFREFFHACKPAIAEVLSATPFPHRWSDKGDWFYQDYALPDTTNVVVGLCCTDEREKGSSLSRSPILWIGVKAEHLAAWPSIAVAMKSQRPDGWREGKAWDGRPVMWRHLATVLEEGSLEDQRSRVAAATRDAMRWLHDATDGSPSAPR